MANGTPEQKWLGIPVSIWDRLFLAIAVAVIGWLTSRNTTAIVQNGEQQTKHAEAQIAKQDEVKVAVEQVKVATQAIPAAAAVAAEKVADKVVEMKAAERP